MASSGWNELRRAKRPGRLEDTQHGRSLRKICDGELARSSTDRVEEGDAGTRSRAGDTHETGKSWREKDGESGRERDFYVTFSPRSQVGSLA